MGVSALCPSTEEKNRWSLFLKVSTSLAPPKKMRRVALGIMKVVGRSQRDIRSATEVLCSVGEIYTQLGGQEKLYVLKTLSADTLNLVPGKLAERGNYV